MKKLLLLCFFVFFASQVAGLPAREKVTGIIFKTSKDKAIHFYKKEVVSVLYKHIKNYVEGSFKSNNYELLSATLMFNNPTFNLEMINYIKKELEKEFASPCKKYLEDSPERRAYKTFTQNSLESPSQSE